MGRKNKTPLDVVMENLRGKNKAVLMKEVSRNFPHIVGAMIDAAKGIWVKEMVPEYDKNRNKTGKLVAKLYEVKPNTEIGKYLIDQMAGKPKETMEVKGRVSLTMDED
jgi:hypothetical protein